MSAHQLARAITQVFEEDICVREARAAYPNNPERRISSFADRCAASGAQHLVQAVDIDQSVSGTSRLPRFGEAPTKRIRLAAAALNRASLPVGNRSLWRFPGHLEAEASVRVQLMSVSASWKSTRSGWSAWGSFSDALHPLADHFPIKASSIGAFSAFFANPTSLAKYIGHLKLATRVLGLQPIQQDIVSGILRGALKYRLPARKSFLRKQDTAHIVRSLVDSGDILLARLCSVAYHYQLRAVNEGFPLQIDGRLGIAANEDRWHSQVKINGNSATIVLRTRKNARSVTSIRRECICNTSRVVCGVCSLKAMVRAAVRAGADPAQPIFGVLSAHSARTALIRAGATAGVGHVSWHGFRRGRTVDLCSEKDASGRPRASLQDLFDSGGWASGSRAIFSYLREEDLNRPRTAEALAALSDSE